MKKSRLINNMKLDINTNSFTVSAPTKTVGRHPSYYRKVADFVNKEDAIMFMKVNLSYVSPKTREKKTDKWIAIGIH